MASTIQTLDGGRAWYSPPTGPMTLGEAPIYRSSDSTLHWVDCLSSPPELHILHIDPVSGSPLGTARVLILDESVSAAYFREAKKGSYICAYYAGIAYLDEDTGKLEVLKEIIPAGEREERRFNDGGVDAKGRFWAAEIDKLAANYPLGQLPKEYGGPKGRLWRYDPDGSLYEMASGLICGNAVEWSPDNKTFYLNDSMGQKTYSYDFELETGSISNKKVLIDFTGTTGEPDGMVVDADGNLWMGVYGSNSVKVYDPEGKHLKDIKFSGKNITCPTWGGNSLDLLFVTSGRREPDGIDEGGVVFRCKVLNGPKGTIKHEFAG